MLINLLNYLLRLRKPSLLQPSTEQVIIIIILIMIMALVNCKIRNRQQTHYATCQCPLNRKAFSLLLKVSSDMSADRRSTGRLFHTRGP